MPRKITVTAKEIWKRRADNYARHYEKHQKAMSLPEEIRARAIYQCSKFPEPTIGITGDLDGDYFCWKTLDQQVDGIRALPGIDRELFVRWYWSETHWQTYVSLFNSLPEPYPEYTYKFGERVMPYLTPTSIPVKLPSHVYKSEKVE